MNDSLISSSMRRGRIRSRLFGAVIGPAGRENEAVEQTVEYTRKRGENQPKSLPEGRCPARTYSHTPQLRRTAVAYGSGRRKTTPGPLASRGRESLSPGLFARVLTRAHPHRRVPGFPPRTRRSPHAPRLRSPRAPADTAGTSFA